MTRCARDHLVTGWLVAAAVFLSSLPDIGHAQDCNIPLDTLAAFQEFGGSNNDVIGGFDRPGGIAVLTSGEIAITDQGNGRLILYYSTGDVKREIRTLGPSAKLDRPIDLATDGSKLIVADKGLRKIFILDENQQLVREVGPGFPIDRIVVTPKHKLLTTTNRKKDTDPLFREYDMRGKFIESKGMRIDGGHLPPAASSVANRVICAYNDNGALFTCYTSIGGYVIGETISDYGDLETLPCDTRKARAWFYENHPDKLDVLSLDTSNTPTVSDLLNDLTEAIGTTAPYVNYATDVVAWQDRFLVLVSGIVHEYDESGTLLRRTTLLDENGNPVFAHRIAMSSDGMLYALDTFHTFLCRVFRYS